MSGSVDNLAVSSCLPNQMIGGIKKSGGDKTWYPMGLNSDKGVRCHTKSLTAGFKSMGGAKPIKVQINVADGINKKGGTIQEWYVRADALTSALNFSDNDIKALGNKKPPEAGQALIKALPGHLPELAAANRSTRAQLVGKEINRVLGSEVEPNEKLTELFAQEGKKCIHFESGEKQVGVFYDSEAGTLQLAGELESGELESDEQGIMISVKTFELKDMSSSTEKVLVNAFIQSVDGIDGQATWLERTTTQKEAMEEAKKEEAKNEAISNAVGQITADLSSINNSHGNVAWEASNLEGKLKEMATAQKDAVHTFQLGHHTDMIGLFRKGEDNLGTLYLVASTSQNVSGGAIGTKAREAIMVDVSSGAVTKGTCPNDFVPSPGARVNFTPK